MELVVFIILWGFLGIVLPKIQNKKDKSERDESYELESSEKTVDDLLHEVEQERFRRGLKQMKSEEDNSFYNLSSQIEVVDNDDKIFFVDSELSSEKIIQREISTPKKRVRLHFHPTAVEKGIVWAEILQAPRARRPLQQLWQRRH